MSAPLYIPLVRDPKKILAGHADDSISAASVIPPPAVDSQFVYVAKWGNDTNTGGPFDPFLTVSAALASIIDASGGKPYTVLIGPGIYTGETTHALLRNFIFLRGTAFTRYNDAAQEVHVFIETDDDSDVTVEPGALICGASNINFENDVDLSAGANSAVYTFDNVYYAASLKVLSATYNGKVFLNDCLLLNNSIQLHAGAVILSGSYINDIEILVTGPVFLTSRYSYIGSTFANTTVATWNYEINLHNTDAFENGAGFADAGLNGNCRFNYDFLTNAVNPSDYAGTGITVTQNGSVNADRGFYKPAASADWGGTVPTTIQQALDLIAANLAPVS